MSEILGNEYLDLYEAIWKNAITYDRKNEPKRLVDEVATEICKLTGIYDETLGKFELVEAKMGKLEEVVAGLRDDLHAARILKANLIKRLQGGEANSKKSVSYKKKLQLINKNYGKESRLIRLKLKIARRTILSLKRQKQHLKKDKQRFNEYNRRKGEYEKLAKNICKRRTGYNQTLEETLQAAITEKVLGEGKAWPKEADSSQYYALFSSMKKEILKTIKSEKEYRKVI